jgi:hypothetical protein
MLSKYLPKKLYNAAADEDGTDLTALSGLANERLDVLEDWVGDYAAPAKGSESDIATDLKKVYADVETDETGLLARATALETMIGDYTPEDTDLATDLAKVYGDVETAETGLLARVAALEAVAPEYVDTFAIATAAQGTLTLADNVTADDEVTIGSITYKFVAEPAAAYDVAIADTASDTIDNLIAAITAGEGVGTAYGAGTVAHPDVTAAAGDNDTMTVTALVKGAAGNAIGTTDPTDDGDVISFGAAALAGGINGQIGATGKIIFTGGAVYFCADGEKCVIADSSGWKVVQGLRTLLEQLPPKL